MARRIEELLAEGPIKDGKWAVAGFSSRRWKEASPTVKYAVIDRGRDKYTVSIICKFFGVSRSGYYGYVKRKSESPKDAVLARWFQNASRAAERPTGTDASIFGWCRNAMTPDLCRVSLRSYLSLFLIPMLEPSSGSILHISRSGYTCPDLLWGH